MPHPVDSKKNTRQFQPSNFDAYLWDSPYKIIETLRPIYGTDLGKIVKKSWDRSCHLVASLIYPYWVYFRSKWFISLCSPLIMRGNASSRLCGHAGVVRLEEVVLGSRSQTMGLPNYRYFWGFWAPLDFPFPKCAEFDQKIRWVNAPHYNAPYSIWRTRGRRGARRSPSSRPSVTRRAMEMMIIWKTFSFPGIMDRPQEGYSSQYL